MRNNKANAHLEKKIQPKNVLSIEKRAELYTNQITFT